MPVRPPDSDDPNGFDLAAALVLALVAAVALLFLLADKLHP